MTTTTLIVLFFLFFLLLNGMPVGFALLVSGSAGLLSVAGLPMLMGVLKSSPYEQAASFSLSTIPMFILMAELLTAGKVTRELFAACHSWLGRLRGGLSFASVTAGVMLAAISGSSSASAGTLAAAAYPEMKRYGYNEAFATGVVATVGTLAMMIPPSIGLVLYGIFTETSVSQLLLGGIVPGLMTAVGYAITIFVITRLKPNAAPAGVEVYTTRQKMKSLVPIWPVITLMVVMIGAIYSGIVTPTEAGAVGSLVALLLALIKRRMSWADFLNAMENATRNSAMIFMIIIGAMVFGVFLALTGSTQDLIVAIQESGMSKWWIFLAFLLMYVVLGFFLDQLAILILTLPLVFPIMMSLGFDPVWLGILFVKTAEIGLVSPPLGLNVYIVGAVTKVPVSTVFRGIMPFLIADFTVLFLIVLFPQLALYIPQLSSAVG
ncbi:TRAP transporter large permease [bacterium]|nr:TRAP transporter large permease [bacterium]